MAEAITLSLEQFGAPIRGVVAHAQAVGDGRLLLRSQAGSLTVASLGRRSFLLADLEAAGGAQIDGVYEAAPWDDPTTGGGDLRLAPTAAGLRLTAGRARATARRLEDTPGAVEWMWPATAAPLEIVIDRDALLDALPDGSGELVYDGEDKVLEVSGSGRGKMLRPSNRPRRRRPLRMAVSFDELRLLVEPQDSPVVLGIAEQGPLTVTGEGPLRGALAPAAPERPRSGGASSAAGEAARKRADEARRRREQAEADRLFRATAAAAGSIEEALRSLEAARRALADTPAAGSLDPLERIEEELRELLDGLRQGRSG
jgi:hypothetical protein